MTAVIILASVAVFMGIGGIYFLITADDAAEANLAFGGLLGCLAYAWMTAMVWGGL